MPYEQSSALTLDNFSGTSRDLVHLNGLLALANKECHLVSPAPTVGRLPEGCELALNLAYLDPEEMFKTGSCQVDGRWEDLLAPSKPQLQKLSHMLGISWDPERSGRTDNRQSPHYVCWRAVGSYRAFDSQTIVIHDHKELDLRDSSSQCLAMQAQQEAKLERWKRDPQRRGQQPSGNADSQIREKRQHIQQLAETGAQLRAIRSMGIKAAYRRSELTKPFATARIVFTGATDNPQLRQVFATMIAQSFLQGSTTLFGAAPQAPQMSAPAPMMEFPPIGESAPGYVDAPQNREEEDREPPAEPRRDAHRPSQDRPQSLSSDSSAKPLSGFTIPGGRNKGTAIEEAAEQDLRFWVKRFSEDLETNNSRYPERDREKLAAFNGELDRREGRGRKMPQGASVPGSHYPQSDERY